MNAIHALRLKACLTQKELSEKLHVDQSAVSLWENGLSQPRCDKLPALAHALGCSIDDLFGVHKESGTGA